MGFIEEERVIQPPPWGWPSAAEKNAHGIGQIVYNGCFKDTITKGRYREQEKLYHKKTRRCAPDARNARNPREGIERLRQEFDHHHGQAVRKAAQPAARHLAARIEARRDRPFKAKVYYTRAYASYEKGSIENCNRLVRRWYPKGTDFNSLSRKQIRQLEDTINSIHRESLNGETAYAYDSRIAKVA